MYQSTNWYIFGYSLLSHLDSQNGVAQSDDQDQEDPAQYANSAAPKHASPAAPISPDRHRGADPDPGRDH